MKERHKQIIDILSNSPNTSSGALFDELGGKFSLPTLKRDLKALKNKGYVTSTGVGKGTKYSQSPAYQLISPIDAEEYFGQEQDDRHIIDRFQFDLLYEILPEQSVFNERERQELYEVQKEYTRRITSLPEATRKSETERLAIDLSWKSSQIEGNTYTLLDTENLIKEKKTAAGKTQEEAFMLLNHKKAIDLLFNDPDFLDPLLASKIEDIHGILMKDLDVGRNIRSSLVRITGTNFRPLDNEHQIREAMQAFCLLINKKEDPFEKALLTLVLIPYIQPFEDGNKRTGRIISNGLLALNQCCPLSFRTVDPQDFKKAILLFYEQNNLSMFKKIFIDQMRFAVSEYYG